MLSIRVDDLISVRMEALIQINRHLLNPLNLEFVSWNWLLAGDRNIIPTLLDFKGMVLAQMPGRIFALKSYYLLPWKPDEHTRPT
jgi:hypothetical protein